jgi:hypothetical protein
MRWKSGRRSGNVEDRRGKGPVAVGGGLVGILIVAAVVLLGGDPSTVAPLLEGSGASEPPPPEQAETVDFVHVVLGSTEDVWNELLGDAAYREPTLVLFSGRTSSACGLGDAAMGPFYCPADHQVYLDLTFFEDLAEMGGGGEFAAAYVIGHEVGHHVQNLLGTSTEVRRAQQGLGQAEANRLSVNLELQADCYSGVWAHHANRTQRMLEPGDVDDGLAAAAAIGDDRLMRRAGRDVVPEAFTHGSSEQRRTWLLRGLESGDPASCDTF